MKKIATFLRFALFILLFSFFIFHFAACDTEGVKLNGNDRVAVDTLSSSAIAKLTPILDKQCRDSSDVLRKKLVDSLVILREREIIMQTLPPNH